jgi:DNA-directed RNA polymerase specialized sigma24 family protein
MGYIPASGDNNPDTIYRSKELERIIKTLHADFRLPFTMHLEGFMYQEIADKLDLSMGTIKSRIFFARKKLMKQLAG